MTETLSFVVTHTHFIVTPKRRLPAGVAQSTSLCHMFWGRWDFSVTRQLGWKLVTADVFLLNHGLTGFLIKFQGRSWNQGRRERSLTSCPLHVYRVRAFDLPLYESLHWACLFSFFCSASNLICSITSGAFEGLMVWGLGWHVSTDGGLTISHEANLKGSVYLLQKLSLHVFQVESVVLARSTR